MSTHDPPPGRQLRTQHISSIALEPSNNFMRGECTSDFGEPRLGTRIGSRDTLIKWSKDWIISLHSRQVTAAYHPQQT
jgi:hypothetical protein